MINFVLIFRFLAHARIRICVAFVLHDMGNDDEAMREADEADKMLRDGECFEDFVEIHNVKANIILSRSKNSTEHRKLVLSHLERSLYFYGKVSVDKSVTMVQETMCQNLTLMSPRLFWAVFHLDKSRDCPREAKFTTTIVRHCLPSGKVILRKQRNWNKEQDENVSYSLYITRYNSLICWEASSVNKRRR